MLPKSRGSLRADALGRDLRRRNASPAGRLKTGEAWITYSPATRHAQNYPKIYAQNYALTNRLVAESTA